MHLHARTTTASGHMQVRGPHMQAITRPLLIRQVRKRTADATGTRAHSFGGQRTRPHDSDRRATKPARASYAGIRGRQPRRAAALSEAMDNAAGAESSRPGSHGVPALVMSSNNLRLYGKKPKIDISFRIPRYLR